MASFADTCFLIGLEDGEYSAFEYKLLMGETDEDQLQSSEE
jgi:hypothetical protein